MWSMNARRCLRLVPLLAILMLSAPGSDRTSEIKHLVRQHGSLIIQGPGQGSRAWSAVFDTESGKFTAAVEDNQYSFSIFGACTPR